MKSPVKPHHRCSLRQCVEVSRVWLGVNKENLPWKLLFKERRREENRRVGRKERGGRGREEKKEQGAKEVTKRIEREGGGVGRTGGKESGREKRQGGEEKRQRMVRMKGKEIRQREEKI